jgi:hypothetical protein
MVPAFRVLSSFLYPCHQELETSMGRPTRDAAYSLSTRTMRWRRGAGEGIVMAGCGKVEEREWLCHVIVSISLANINASCL